MIVWRKSSRSGGVNDNACVEVARVAVGVGVRDSKDPEGDRLGLSRREFTGLLERIKRGDFDR
jgi:hypothetical protein